MPDWLAGPFGILAGIGIVAAALAWALRPRPRARKSRLASPTDPGLQYEETYGAPSHDGDT